jgi:hypothetical protein
MSLLGDNVDIVEKNTETLIDVSSKEVGLEVNTENTKHLFMSGHQNPGQNHYINRAIRSFENVASDIWEQ